jgi:DAACS family dicarboxylate/amino acid:cation (Na+ or H+) symporter
MKWNPFRWPLATQIILGLVVGAAAGLTAELLLGPSPSLRWAVQNVAQPLGSVFLRIIFMVVIPLIFAAIVLGIADMGDIKKLGKAGGRCLLITVIFAAVSVAIGIGLVNALEPGRRLPPEKRQELVAQYGGAAARDVEQARQKAGLAETLLNLIPTNPLNEAVNAFNPKHTGGGLLAFMIFSLFVGIAVAALPAETAAGLIALCRSLFAVAMKIIGFAMRLAPFGVAFLGFSVTALLGPSILQTLGFYVLVVIGGLAIHQFVTFSVALVYFGRKSPVQFFRQSKDAILMAFATASSNATLPVSLQVAERNLKLPPEIARFVLTIGASANQNGTALYEGVTVLFLAQVFGVDLTITQQITVAVMCIIAGVGTAGVPGGSLPLVVSVLVAVGVPGEAIAIVLGVDRLLDMCRTTLNVTGDLVCAVLVARGQDGAAGAPGHPGSPQPAPV